MKVTSATASSALALALMLAGPGATATESANQDRGHESGSNEARHSESEQDASARTDASHAGQSMGSGQAGMSGSGETDGSGSDQAGTSGSGEAGTSESEQIGSSGSGQTGASSDGGVRVDKLAGSKIVNDSGEEIGEVTKVVRGTHGGTTQAVVSIGGLFGIGDKEVLMPLEDLRMEGDKLRAPSDIANTKDQLELLPNYDGNRFEELSGDKTVTVGTRAMSTHQGGGSSGRN